MEAFDDMWRRDADGGDEESSTFGYGDGDELVKLAVGVIMVGLACCASDFGESL